MREVAAGFDCGIVLRDFADVKEGDVLETYATRQVERELACSRWAPMSDSGFVAVLVIDLHFPDAGSLKSKRKELSSIKAQLHGRLGAAVSEVGSPGSVAAGALTAALTGGSLRGADRGGRQRRALARGPVARQRLGVGGS